MQTSFGADPQHAQHTAPLPPLAVGSSKLGPFNDRLRQHREGIVGMRIRCTVCERIEPAEHQGLRAEHCAARAYTRITLDPDAVMGVLHFKGRYATAN